MLITPHTKIASILREQPAALDAITSISPRFEKLRNPILRKLMAGRTTLESASKMGGCTLDDFYIKLEPLGFHADRTVNPDNEIKPLPAFIRNLDKKNLIDLDVRPVIASGKDPLHIILEAVKNLKHVQVLRIINSFEPAPLIPLLEKKGFEAYVNHLSPDHVETYFSRKNAMGEVETALVTTDHDDWNEVVLAFTGRIIEVDVRHLQMPQPMFTILGSLDQLEKEKALYVYHKRTPVFLLPELKERNFEYRTRQVSEDQVHMIIFHK